MAMDRISIELSAAELSRTTNMTAEEKTIHTEVINLLYTAVFTYFIPSNYIWYRRMDM